ncbi:MAG: hypothetical protein J6Y71_04510 [Ruminococcus sp.]|nr:hypothetical protein [Ruminococcus sp.]
MKKGNSNALYILAIIVTVIIFVTHCKDLDRVPGVHVEPGEVSVEIGDFSYHS